MHTVSRTLVYLSIRRSTPFCCGPVLRAGNKRVPERSAAESGTERGYQNEPTVQVIRDMNRKCIIGLRPGIPA